VKRGKNNIKLEVGDLLRKHLIKNGDVLELTPEQFIRLRRVLRRRDTRQLADTAFRTYMAVLNMSTNGALYKQPLRNIAALAISARKIAKCGWQAQERLDKLADHTKISRARAKVLVETQENLYSHS